MSQDLSISSIQDTEANNSPTKVTVDAKNSTEEEPNVEKKDDIKDDIQNKSKLLGYESDNSESDDEEEKTKAARRKEFLKSTDDFVVVRKDTGI